MTSEIWDYIKQLEQRIEALEGKQLPAKVTAKPVNNKKGTRLKEDWKPPVAAIAWARTDYPFIDLRLETEKFIDYWMARPDKGAIKLNWDRTWRNWIRNAASFYRGPRNEAHKRTDRLDLNEAIINSFD